MPGNGNDVKEHGNRKIRRRCSSDTPIWSCRLIFHVNFYYKTRSQFNVDKNAAYPKAIDGMKAKEKLAERKKIRCGQNKYLNNPVGPSIYQTLTKPGMGSFNATHQTLAERIQAIDMLRKGPDCRSPARNVLAG